MFNFILSFILMINASVLSTKLAGLIGMRNSYNPEYAIIDIANQGSRSGLYINDNPFIKVESIKDSQDYAEITDEDFNTFIRNKISASIVNVANAVFSQPDYIDRQLIYKNALNKFSQNQTPDVSLDGNYVNVYNIPEGFNCYWFQVADKNNIAFKIERVFLEFNGAGNITLHLFNTADVTTPLKSKTINVAGPFQEVLLDWVCDNTGAGYKGDYYLGYFKSECDISLQPFKREYRAASVTSIIDQLPYYKTCFGNFKNLTDPFDLTQLSMYNVYNGINPDISVYEDFTDQIVQNEKLFARAIQLDCQIGFLSESMASLRSNRNERISQSYGAQIMAQIEGETGENNVKVKGLRPQFYGAIGSIKKELSKLTEGYTDHGQIRIETLS